MKVKFNLNGVDYKVVDSLVHKYSRFPSMLDPCYQGDSEVLDEYCRTHNLTLYQRPKGLHAYGHQTGQRGKTLALTQPLVGEDKDFRFTECAQGIPVDHTEAKRQARELRAWNWLYFTAGTVVGSTVLTLIYELFFV